MAPDSDTTIATNINHSQMETNDHEEPLLQTREQSSLDRRNSYESMGSLEEADEEDQDIRLLLDSLPSDEERINASPPASPSDRSPSVASSDGSSEEGGRDSGIEAERELDMVIPDEELMGKISTQVELYFGDANVAKDKFLLKHIRRNKEGFVSLKLVSSFKKVKQLTKDWRVVAFALSKMSTKIQINELGTKIRRVDPLPEMDDTPVTRAILALNLPLQKPTIASVSILFGGCGEIAVIRVLRAGSDLPSDVKQLISKFPELGQTHCAWLEFETPESAKESLELADDEMKVCLIFPEAVKKTQEKQKPLPLNRKNSAPPIMAYQQKTSTFVQRKTSSFAALNRNRKDTSSSGSDGESSPVCPNWPANNVAYPRRPVAPRRKAASVAYAHTPNAAIALDARHQRPKSKSFADFNSSSQNSTSPPSSSWVQRHLLAAAAASAASAASPVSGSRSGQLRQGRLSQGSLPIPEGVMRFPRGPDGSRGFSRPSKDEEVAHEVC